MSFVARKVHHNFTAPFREEGYFTFPLSVTIPHHTPGFLDVYRYRQGKSDTPASPPAFPARKQRQMDFGHGLVREPAHGL